MKKQILKMIAVTGIIVTTFTANIYASDSVANDTRRVTTTTNQNDTQNTDQNKMQNNDRQDKIQNNDRQDKIQNNDRQEDPNSDRGRKTTETKKNKNKNNRKKAIRKNNRVLKNDAAQNEQAKIENIADTKITKNTNKNAKNNTNANRIQKNKKNRNNKKLVAANNRKNKNKNTNGKMKNAKNTETYEVQKGDTLWEISNQYDTKLKRMINENPHIADPNLIYPEDHVYVPIANQGKSDIGASMCDQGDGKVKDNPKVEFNTQQGVESQTNSNQFETKVAELVNQERARAGLAPLKLDTKLSNVARIKSEDMRDSGYFSHQSPTYGSPFDMMKQFGLQYATAGENIAKGQKTPEAVMNAWMNSTGHKANILNKNYKELGVGYVTDSSGTTYWTQQFMTSK